MLRCNLYLATFDTGEMAEMRGLSPSVSQSLRARLHHHAGSYSVLFNGKVLVERSRDPECDAARALLAQGITGELTTARPASLEPSSTLRRPRGSA
jgi:hypothetical protein